MDVAKRKITVKVTYNAPSTSSRPPSRTSSPRPPSPSKHAKSPTEGSATFKPKAKINSSAAIRRSPSVVSGVASGTQRAGSPTRNYRGQNSSLSPSFQPRVASTASKVSIRPQTPASAPNTPEVRSRNLSPGSEVGRNTAPRVRDGSSLHHAMSFSSLQTAPQDRNDAPSIRIRSKVSNISNVSKALNQETRSPSPTPTAPAQIRASKTFNDNMLLSSNPSAPVQMRVRSPSTSSSVSQLRNNAQTPPPLYPITTGSPAANPHRFGQRSPPNQQHTYQGLAISSPSNHLVNARPRISSTARVNPASIPLPPTSPPGSTVSFSSRSSHSQSSSIGDNSLLDPSPLDGRPVSSATELLTPSDFGSPRAGFPVDESSAPASAVDLNDEERKVKAEAKSNRKMADLEITNRSLLSINSSLEATKNKQAKEIRELRRKLRETRLILPPRAYREYKSSMEPEEEEPAADEEDEDSEVEDAAEGNGDEIYKRVKIMLEGLISSGKQALEAKVEDFAETKGVAKVLTAEEVKSWHRSNDAGARHDGDDSDTDSMSVSQADVSVASTNGEEDDDPDHPEEDGGTSILSHFFTGGPAGPPIHISEAT